MSASAGFHGPSFASKVSRWLGPPFMLMKMQARAVFLVWTPPGVVWASAWTLNSEALAAPKRKCRRVKGAWPPHVVGFQYCFIAPPSVECEIELVEQRPLQVAEPLIPGSAAAPHHQSHLAVGGIACQRGQKHPADRLGIVRIVGVDFMDAVGDAH